MSTKRGRVNEPETCHYVAWGNRCTAAATKGDFCDVHAAKAASELMERDQEETDKAAAVHQKNMQSSDHYRIVSGVSKRGRERKPKQFPFEDMQASESAHRIQVRHGLDPDQDDASEEGYSEEDDDEGSVEEEKPVPPPLPVRPRPSKSTGRPRGRPPKYPRADNDGTLSGAGAAPPLKKRLVAQEGGSGTESDGESDNDNYLLDQPAIPNLQGGVGVGVGVGAGVGAGADAGGPHATSDKKPRKVRMNWSRTELSALIDAVSAYKDDADLSAVNVFTKICDDVRFKHIIAHRGKEIIREKYRLIKKKDTENWTRIGKVPLLACCAHWADPSLKPAKAQAEADPNAPPKPPKAAPKPKPLPPNVAKKTKVVSSWKPGDLHWALKLPTPQSMDNIVAEPMTKAAAAAATKTAAAAAKTTGVTGAATAAGTPVPEGVPVLNLDTAEHRANREVEGEVTAVPPPLGPSLAASIAAELEAIDWSLETYQHFQKNRRKSRKLLTKHATSMFRTLCMQRRQYEENLPESMEPNRVGEPAGPTRDAIVEALGSAYANMEEHAERVVLDMIAIRRLESVINPGELLKPAVMALTVSAPGPSWTAEDAILCPFPRIAGAVKKMFFAGYSHPDPDLNRLPGVKRNATGAALKRLSAPGAASAGAAAVAGPPSGPMRMQKPPAPGSAPGGQGEDDEDDSDDDDDDE